MAHSGPFRCQCGQIHADQYDGPTNDLLPYIDTAGVSALNESEAGACRRIFRPFDQRLQRDAWLQSEDDDPQLLITIPFTSPVKIQSLTVIGGADGSAPRELRAYINQEALDFDDADRMMAVQTWQLQEGDAEGRIEYPTQFSRFQNVSRLHLLVVDNYGADETTIYYIGLKGIGTDHQRKAVQASREIAAGRRRRGRAGAAGRSLVGSDPLRWWWFGGWGGGSGGEGGVVDGGGGDRAGEFTISAVDRRSTSYGRSGRGRISRREPAALRDD